MAQRSRLVHYQLGAFVHQRASNEISRSGGKLRKALISLTSWDVNQTNFSFCLLFQELKKEISERTECLFKKESVLMSDESLIDRMRSTMKRIMRLDSYIQQSLSASKSPSFRRKTIPVASTQSRSNYYTHLKKCPQASAHAWPRIKAMLN